MVLDRRTFLRTGVAGFGSILLMPSCFRQESSWLFFTNAEAACVMALCEQIIPADEHGGGATEAGVINYIDRQLVAVFDYDQVVYQLGISALQANCLELHGQRIESMGPAWPNTIRTQFEGTILPKSEWGRLG